MTAYTRYYDNTSITEWANTSLTPEELVVFNQDFDENTALWATYATSGIISEPQLVYETVYVPALGIDVQVVVGEKMVLRSDTNINDLQLSPKWGHWLSRYSTEVAGSTVLLTADSTPPQ
jgi:hypothetical protein